MHEMAIAESMLTIIEDEARKGGVAKVRKVFVEVGPFSGVEVEALRFSFEVVRNGTVADGALLEVMPTRGEAWCLDCAKSVVITERYSPCPDCGGHALQVTAGDELRIKELEVD